MLSRAVSLSFLLVWPAALLAQSVDPVAPAPAVQDPLAARQQIVRDRLVQLEDRMYRLSEKLRENEPDQAQRLEAALRQAGELLIRHHMDQAIQALERAELAQAAEHQAAAEKALQNILTLLTETRDEELDRQRELDRIRDLRAQVDKMLERQQQLRARTDPSEQLAERLAAAAAKVRELIERQETQAGKTREADTGQSDADADAAAALAEAQAAIRDDAEATAGDLDQPTTRSQGDPLAPLGEKARRDLQDAADRMRTAERELGEGRMDQARRPQDQALESLRRALESLEKAGKTAQPLDSAEAAREQRALEQEAGKLSDSMHEGEEGTEPGPQSDADQGQPGEPGQPQPGPPQPGEQPAGQQPSGERPAGEPGESQEGGEQPQAGEQEAAPEHDAESRQPSGPQMPGADKVRKAAQHMKRAGDKLERDQPGQATEDQDKAIEELRRAQAELDETLDQLRREQQEEMLAGLEQRFRTMLIQQKSLNAATADLDARKESWTRKDSLSLAELSEKQNVLSGEAGRALNILTEEGTTVVFPQIVEQLRDDMLAVSRRLGEQQTGPVTRGIQEQIVATLEELIKAIEQRQKDGPPPPSGGQGDGAGGGEGETPLLPGSAELKLLRSCQVRINQQTQQLSEAGAEPAAEIGDQAQRLSDRQEQLADMARKIHERAEGP